MNKQTELLQKEAALISCIDALAPLNSYDFDATELIDAIQTAHTALSHLYPNMQQLKRKTLKEGSTDSDVRLIAADLRQCLEGKGTSVYLSRMNAMLAEALDIVQNDIAKNKAFNAQ